MNVHFVATTADEFALECLRMLSESNYRTTALDRGERAPKGSIALFQVGPPHLYGISMGTHVKFAAPELLPLRPSWASSTPFLVGVRRNISRRKAAGLMPALLTVAYGYAAWNPSQPKHPWETKGGTVTKDESSLARWWEEVRSVYPNARVYAA